MPASVAADADALHEFLHEHEELWIDALDSSGTNGCLTVNERCLDRASVVLTA